MKKIILALGIMTLAIGAYAQVENKTDNVLQAGRVDTVANVAKPHKVVIYEKKSGGVVVDVTGSEKSKKFTYRYSTDYSKMNNDSIEENLDLKLPFLPSTGKENRRCVNKVTVESFYAIGLHYGFMNMAGTPSGTAKMGESAELGLLCPISFAVRFPHEFTLVTGFGFGWKNYRLSSEQMFAKDEAGDVVITRYGEGTYHRLSRLKLFYLDVPLMFKKSLGRFAVSAGAVLNFNVHGTILSRYRIEQEGNTEVKRVDDGIGQRKVTADLMATAEFSDFGLYVKYNPSTVLKTNGKVPDFRSFSVGFIFGF